MKYKLWFWICLGISIVSILITIYNIENTYNERSWIPKSARSRFQKVDDSLISGCDSITKLVRAEYDERFKSELLELHEHTAQTSILDDHGMDTMCYEDSIRIRERLEQEYHKRLYEMLFELGIVMIDSSYYMIIDDNPYDKEDIEKKEQNISETKDSGFTKLSGAASILGLFFTFFFRYKDKKSRRIIKDEERDDEIKPDDPVSMDVDSNSSNPDPKQNEETEVEK